MNTDKALLPITSLSESHLAFTFYKLPFYWEGTKMLNIEYLQETNTIAWSYRVKFHFRSVLNLRELFLSIYIFIHPMVLPIKSTHIWECDMIALNIRILGTRKINYNTKYTGNLHMKLNLPPHEAIYFGVMFWFSFVDKSALMRIPTSTLWVMKTSSSLGRSLFYFWKL